MNSQQDLLYVINSLKTGGAEIGLCRLVDGLNQAQYSITVVTLDGYEKNVKSQLPPEVRFFDLNLTGNPFRIVRLIPLIRESDIVVGSLFHSVLITRILGRLNQEATIATWQHNSRFKNQYRKKIYGFTSRFTDVILADSEPVADFITDQFKDSKKKVHTVPIAGIQPKEYSVVSHEGTSNLTIGTVGSLTEQKNYPTLLEIASKVPQEVATFEIAGSGKLHKRLMQQKKKENISNVTFHGRVDDIPEFLSNLDIYIQPSIYEGLCITVIEAMAAGLPVVGSNVGGINYNVREGKTGYLHDPNDVDGFVDSVLYLAENPSVRQEFGQNARETVVSNYTQEVLVSEFERAIEIAEEYQ